MLYSPRIAVEEKQIRKDPVKRTTDLMKSVYGYFDKKIIPHKTCPLAEIKKATKWLPFLFPYNVDIKY